MFESMFGDKCSENPQTCKGYFDIRILRGDARIQRSKTSQENCKFFIRVNLYISGILSPESYIVLQLID